MTPSKMSRPEVGDVYRAFPQTSTTGDAHGENGRPVAVVELMARVATTLTRTTHPESDARTVPSPADPELGLSKDGWWTDRHQRPMPYSWFDNPDFCTYLGRLSSETTEKLVAFWEKTIALGRKNL